MADPKVWGLENRDPDRWEWLQPVGFGDYDGDGWEDMLGVRGAGVIEGSGRCYDWVLFTRRESGRVVEISHRIVRPWSPESELVSARREWLESAGFPQNTETVLRGTMQIGIDRVRAITFRLTFDRGYVAGSYMYDHIGIPIALEGAIGVDRHLLLEEYADGITQSASFRLDPTLKDGEIIVDGLWFARGKPEGNRVRAAGRSTLAITPASRTQR